MTELSKRLESGEALVAQETFKVVVWIGVCLCFIVFILRATIRYVCFRRFLIEDGLMVFALCCVVTSAALLLIYIPDLYTTYRVEKGLEFPGPDFINTLLDGVRADGLVVVLAYTGIWAVKLNFLMFFYRLTSQIRSYLRCWWAVFILVLACYFIILGVIPWRCTFSTWSYIMTVCASESGIVHETNSIKAGVGLDVFSDFVLISFPIMVLWRSKINLGQKLILSCIFSVELFTIAVAIVRGSIWGEQSYSVAFGTTVRAMDFVWILFWQYIELIVSFVVACVVSFRSLWTTREQKARNKRYELYKRHNVTPPDHNTIGSNGRFDRKQSTIHGRKKWDHFYDSVLDTLGGLEGTVVDCHDTYHPDYVKLAGKNQHSLTGCSESSAPPSPKAPAGSRASESALAAYCSHLGSSKRNGAILLSPRKPPTEEVEVTEPQPIHQRRESLEIEVI